MLGEELRGKDLAISPLPFGLNLLGGIIGQDQMGKLEKKPNKQTIR